MTTFRKRIIGCGLLISLAGIGWFGWLCFHFLEYGIDNAYAQWGAGSLVTDFMEKHDGEWPKQWEDLRPAYEAGKGQVGGWSFEKFQSRVQIDWSANPKQLLEESVSHDVPTFDVIGPADGIEVRWEGAGGDQILHRYFRRKASENQATTDSQRVND